MDNKKKRIEYIQTGLRIKDDCFAYDSHFRECTALNDLYCAKEKCKFYKPRKKQ